jgi:hypothetical protein
LNTFLLNNIKKASISLRKKIIELPISSLGISAYNQQYLRNKIKEIDSILDIYTRILFLSVKDTHLPLSNFVLVDYGGGSGIFSLLAKEAGVGTVIYSDIYDVSCSDIQKVSKHTQIPINHIVCGDVNALIDFIQIQSVIVNAITSFDVIEHIYDIESHFNKLASFQKCPFRIVYGSGANIENLWKVRTIAKGQIIDEYVNKEISIGHKEYDSLQSFLEIRKNIISCHAPDLEMSTVEQLSRKTRGLIQKDIEKYTDEFLSTGKMSYHINHATNTCDPLTGNWSEHLINLHRLKKMVEHSGYSVTLIPGYYYPNGSFFKKCIKYFLNGPIWLLRRKGMFLAPYYILIAKTDLNNSPD